MACRMVAWVWAVCGRHLGSGDGGCPEALLTGRGKQLEGDGFQYAPAGQVRQAVERLEAGQQRTGFLDGEPDGPLQVEVLGNEDVVIFPLDIEQIIRVPLRQPGADEDLEIGLKFLACDPKMPGDILDVQALVVDQEGDQLEHALELVLGGPFAGRPGVDVDERVGGDGRGAEGCRGPKAAAHCRGEVFRVYRQGVGPVGGKFLGKHFRIAVLQDKPVKTVSGLSVRLLRCGACCAAPQREEAPLPDVHDGGAQRQFRQPVQFGADTEVHGR
ncbi:hypothetical protein QF050_002804 [Arthrobacter sp. SLBN-112]|nr:hypothetical protein [Arthrobacter sp. SLBN-112]